MSELCSAIGHSAKSRILLSGPRLYIHCLECSFKFKLAVLLVTKSEMVFGEDRLRQDWSVFWEKKAIQNQNVPWIDCVVKIFNFSTATVFWSWFHNTVVPSDFPNSVVSIRVFKSSENITKEDSKNVAGGRILFYGDNNAWLKLLLLVISEMDGNFELSDYLAGIVAKRASNIGTGSKIPVKFEVWLKSGTNDETVSKFQIMLAQNLDIPEASFKFQRHFVESNNNIS